MKKIVLGLSIALLLVNPALADFKYTEEVKTETQMPAMFNMFHSMMPNKAGNNSEVKTIYIKGSNYRVDYKNKNTSVITKCDKRQVIVLDHKKKQYNVKSIDDDLANLKGTCESISNASKEMAELQKNPKYKAATNKPLTFKTIITDTKQDEMIGAYKARKYIRETIISGNPSCMPDMDMKEYVWTANIKTECFTCPIYASFKGCKNFGVPAMPGCMKNAKYVKQGLTEVPGFILKTQVTVDMSKMMQGMPAGMETGKAADVFGIMNSAFDVLDRTMQTGQDLKNTVTPNNQYDQEQNNYQQNYQQSYPQQQAYPQNNYPNYQPQYNYPNYQPQYNYPNNPPQYPQQENEQQYSPQMNPQDFKMSSTTTTTRTNISYSPIPASIFEIPAGYKLTKTLNPPEFEADLSSIESTCK